MSYPVYNAMCPVSIQNTRYCGFLWKRAQYFVRLRRTVRKGNNAVIYVPRSGTKIFASLHARLAAQGLARHLIPFEAGFAPSSSPCEEGRRHARRGLPTSKQGRRFHRLPCEKPHNNSSIYRGGEEVNREEAKSVFFEALYKRKASISCILRIVNRGRCAILKIPEEKRKR